MIGNRPQFIKAAAVSGPLRDVADEVLVHTGQHYDDGALAGVLRRARAAAARAPARARRRQQHGADGAHARRAGAAARRASGPALVLVYGDTNSTLAGALAGGAGRDPGRARRGGHALVRPHDAGGAQPRADRPRERPAAVLLGGARRDPARRAGRGRDRGRRRRDGRRRAAARPARRRRAPRCSSASACAPGEYVLATAHRAGNVDDPGAARAARGAAGGGAAPGRAAAAPAHRGAAGRRRAARAPGPAASCSRRRSATSTSPRCCTTRARC